MEQLNQVLEGNITSIMSELVVCKGNAPEVASAHITPVAAEPTICQLQQWQQKQTEQQATDRPPFSVDWIPLLALLFIMAVIALFVWERIN